MFRGEKNNASITNDERSYKARSSTGRVAERLQEGLQEGLQKGLQKGLQEGLQEGLQKVAVNLLKTTDMDIQAISKATGLSEKEVLQIQSKCQ